MADLKLSRAQILRFRRLAGSLDERLPAGVRSLRQAAWAGLQDSMPRAALLSLHARVKGTTPQSCGHGSLVQLWGPRYSNYVVAAKDLAVFSLGRLPMDARRRAKAEDTAARLHQFLAGRRMGDGEACREMGVVHNSLRYGAPTGRILIRWDGAREPLIWTVPAPSMDPVRARQELACRYLHTFGPTTSESFAKWAGVKETEARLTWTQLGGELMAVRTPIGPAWILAGDEPAIRAPPRSPAPARLLPSGDTYYLLWGADRKLLVPDAKRRAALWTSRVWPGAVLVNGEIVGVWRRAGADVSIESWRLLSSAEQQAMEEEAVALPLPNLTGPIGVLFH